MRLIYVLLSVVTCIVGFHIHHSIFWAVMDFLFPVFAWIKWLILKQVTLSIIKGAFAFLLQ